MREECINKTPIEILLVEDQEADIMFTLQAFSHSRVDNNIHTVRNGEEALAFLLRTGEYAEAPRPHLILLDVNMPRKGGIETLREIKANKDLFNIPVIILTSSKDEKDIRAAYDNHANAYVPKQVGFLDMLDFVKKVEDFWLFTARLPQE